MPSITLRKHSSIHLDIILLYNLERISLEECQFSSTSFHKITISSSKALCTFDLQKRSIMHLELTKGIFIYSYYGITPQSHAEIVSIINIPSTLNNTVQIKFKLVGLNTLCMCHRGHNTYAARTDVLVAEDLNTYNFIVVQMLEPSFEA